jgi:hypothetical protein
VALKLQLQDAAGKNQSSSAIPVTALGIQPLATGGSPIPTGVPVDLPFVYNPRLGGKGGGYELVASFNSLPKGPYRLLFTVGGDVVQHEARFTVQ